MDKAEIRKGLDAAWTQWTAELSKVDEAVTREPGVSGDWTLHDVVGHVHQYQRYYLSQVRGAFDHVPASDEEINGARGQLPPHENHFESRNQAMQKANEPLSWQQLLDEAAELRDKALAFADARTEAELHEDVGWLDFWNPDIDKPDDLPIHIRRRSEAPNVSQPSPAHRFIHPDGLDGHMTEHLGQIRAWLAAR